MARHYEKETLYRKTIKITFSLSNNTPNEIMFIETGLTELKAHIYKRQYVFSCKILKNIEEDLTEVSPVIKMAIDTNILHLRHYKNLHKDFSSQQCFKYYDNCLKTKTIADITQKSTSSTYSIPADYLLSNLNLRSPLFYREYN